MTVELETLDSFDTSKIDFEKTQGLVPAVVQDAQSRVVLMLGYMNAEALAKTKETGLVTFFSRSRQTLWTKGETSGNTMLVKNIAADCDSDTLLITAQPTGPVCHTGTDTCFSQANGQNNFGCNPKFLSTLVSIIRERRTSPQGESYTSKLFEKGTAAIAQKVGEESTEVVIEAMKGDNKLLIEESADLLFHFLVLLENQGVDFQDVLDKLESRNS